LVEPRRPIGTVERAFQLAPECSSILEVRARLAKEGCENVEAHVQGMLTRQLKPLLGTAG